MMPSAPALEPLVEGQMRFVDAGAVTFGVVAREFTEETMRPHAGRPGVAEILRRITEEGFWDGGLSIYVFASADRSSDYLRFDCFEVEPHYHYQYVQLTDEDEADQQRIANRADSVVRRGLWYQIPHDPVANGPMFEWVVSRLRTRLPEMLVEAGASALAAQLDQEAVSAAVDEVEALYRVTFPDERWPRPRA